MAVQLDPVLLEVLACPDTHHAPLTVGSPDDPDADALTCTECGRVFEVRDGIPVLLLSDDDSTQEPGGTASTGTESTDAPEPVADPGGPSAGAAGPVAGAADPAAGAAEPGTRP